MKILLFGREGKVGAVLMSALSAAGHDVTGVEVGEVVDADGFDAAVDFTAPAAVHGNAMTALSAGVPCVIGTTGLGAAALEELDALAREQRIPCFLAPNFALGAVLMMRFAAEAARSFPHAEIIELHADTKLDAPSGTANATAAGMGGNVPIHSVRLPGLVAHQEVILGGPGEILTIRHDTTSREAFVPGVMLALDRLRGLPPGLTVGLEALPLDQGRLRSAASSSWWRRSSSEIVASSSLVIRFLIASIGLTTKKNTAAAIATNVITAVMNEP